MRRRWVVLAAVAVTVVLLWQLVPNRGVAASEAPPTVALQRAHAGAAAPNLTKRLAVLVLGSDAGAPNNHRGGLVARGNSDSIHLIVVDGAHRTATMLGIPRDSFVPIPGHGRWKINAAMSFGGPALTVRTVEQLTGIPIDYYLLTSFDGLQFLVDRMGGVRVNVDQRVSDPFSGAFLGAGTQKLNGGQALAYARDRHDVPGGDFGRSRHQGDVLLGGLTTLQLQAKKDPLAVLRLVAAATQAVQTDIPLPELLRLALFAQRVAPRNIRNLVIPGSTADIGGASVVLVSPQAYDWFARVKAGKPI